MHQTSLLDCTPRAAEAPTQAMAAPAGVGSGACSVGRPAVHADAAARVRAFRANRARIDYTDKPEIAATLDAIADQLGCSRNELMQSITRFALTNRNWKQVGLCGSKGLQ
ncbi:hypothetical protein [Variovorax paradoxus]|uniref:hypothetical protein n=1 Tax=Variovorax paradoxus TaxID=34073 RepID=UPI003ED04258